MTNLIATCVVWMWVAGATDVSFEFYADGYLVATTTTPQVTLCQEDTPFYMLYDVWVVGVDYNGRRSLTSTPATARWIYNTDFDGNGITGISDFGRFGPWFGTCNDGRKIIPCS